MELDEISTESRRVALNVALKAAGCDTSPIKNPIPTIFGKKWANFFHMMRKRLGEKYGSRLEDLVILSHRWFVYSGNQASTYMSLSGGLHPDATETLKSLCTPEGYVDYEGWAKTLSDGVATINQPMELLRGTTLSEMPCAADILEGMSLYWFFEAANIQPKDNFQAMNLLFEAMDAAISSNGFFMWDAAVEEGCFASSHSEAASILAKKRHAENYALVEEAIRYWREKIDPKLSASKAAERLIGVVPLSHKKLAELVSAEKKKQL